MQQLGSGVEYLLNPRSIAIVGVSDDFDKTRVTGATSLMMNLVNYGYKGRVYPINPKHSSIMGFKCYPDLKSLPEPVNLVVLGVNNEKVIPLLKEVIEKGVKGAIVIAAGFAEIGEGKGRCLQDQLRKLAQESGVRICGPNCLGIINIHGHIMASASTGLRGDKLLPGKVGLISQSGGMSTSIFARAYDAGIGFSYFISSGNEADLETSDYISYLSEDENTEVIAVFMEGVKDGEKFITALKLCREKKKPLVVFKVGRSKQAARTAIAHTGSLTGVDQVCEAIFRQYGVIRAGTLDELFEIAGGLVKSKKIVCGNRLGILSLSGGSAGIIADLCHDLGIDIPDFSPITTQKIKIILPPHASVANPVDPTSGFLRDFKVFNKLYDVMAADENVDLIFIAIPALEPDVGEQVARTIVEFSYQAKKPVVVCWYTGSVNKEGIKILRESNLPFFTSFEIALRYVKAITK